MMLGLAGLKTRPAPAQASAEETRQSAAPETLRSVLVTSRAARPQLEVQAVSSLVSSNAAQGGARGGTYAGAQRAHALSHVHVPALDGMRGIAILLVMIYHFASSLAVLGIHSRIFDALRLGWCGVDVFFALSGFLITGILLDTRDAPNYFTSFYARRVLRIFPLYYGSLAVVLLLHRWMPDAGIWGAQDGIASAGSLLWPSLFLQNLAFYISGSGATGVTAHYWSLAVEEHFYLCWPLAVWLLRPRQLVPLAGAVLLLSVSGRFLALMHGSSLDAVMGLTPLRTDGLAIGALAALAIRISPDWTIPFRWARVVLAGSLLALLATVLARHSMQQSDPALWMLSYPLVSAATASALVLTLRNGWLASMLSNKLLRWFGKYSFGLYVWHPIVGMVLFHSTYAVVGRDMPPILLLAVATAVFGLDLLVAWLSFAFWEKRFLDLKRFFKAGSSSRPEPVVNGMEEWKHAAIIPRR
jgi:peptidoglycan/LPS O-acetylase OafA/YrhL